MPITNAQNDVMRSVSNPLSELSNPVIPYSREWPRYLQRIWLENANSGSEIFWLLFAASVEDWRLTGD